MQQNTQMGAVSAAVGDLEAMTQKSATMVNELSSSANGLKTQAQALTDSVCGFKIG